MKKAIGIIVILFLQFNIIVAQNSLEIGGVYSLTSERIVPHDYLTNKLYHSFGINGKKIFPSNFFVQGGLHLRNFGAKTGDENYVIDHIPIEIVGQSIDIPINIGYYFLNKRRVRLGMSLGVNNGILINDYQDNYGYIVENITIYNDYLLHLNSSIELGLRLTDNIILDIKPIFQRQINSNYRSRIKQQGIGCQFGISYAFTEK